jgi:hypothetical protein
MSRGSTTTRTTRRVGLSVAFVIVLVSAVYVVVDLARWEWNRAVLAALMCLAALVVFSTTLILGQLTRIDQRLDEVARRSIPEQSNSQVAAESAGAGVAHFAWLEPQRDRGVFVPILLGAGAILSFLASVVERISGAVAQNTLGAGELDRLGVHLPLGDATVAVGHVARPHRSRAHRVVVGAFALMLMAVSVEGLRQLTQSRPGDVMAEGSTVVEVVVEQRRGVQAPELVVVELWGACRSRLGTGMSPMSVLSVAEGRVRLELDRALGTTGRRRLVGCFEDHTLDLVRADVVVLEVHPAQSRSVP